MHDAATSFQVEVAYSTQVFLPTFLAGILFLGAFTTAYLYRRLKNPLYLVVSVGQVCAMVFVASEAFVCYAGDQRWRAAGAWAYVVEQLAALLFLFIVPWMLDTIPGRPYPLATRWVRNVCGVAVAFILVGAFAFPDSFISTTRFGAISAVKEVDWVRGQAGPLYQLRDALLALMFVYAVVYYSVLLKRGIALGFVRWTYAGLVVTILLSLNDLVNVYTQHNMWLRPPPFDFSTATVGLSLFSVLTMFGVAKTFIQQIQDNAETMRQSEKLTSIGQLAGGVAHDFNNLLAGIQGFAELVQYDPSASERVVQYADGIRSAVGRAAMLNRQLLAFARKSAAVKSPMSCHEVLAGTVSIARRTMDKRIEIVSELRATHDVIHGDATLVMNTFMNILLNARDAMPEGGSIRVETDNVEVDAAFCAEHGVILSLGEHIRVRIVDTGCGMPPEVLGRVFEPFFTTKATGKGTGLGLAAAYGAVQQHGGHIEVRSAVGVGSVFDIFFRALESGAVSDRAAAEVVEGDGEHILVIEDDPTVRVILERVLSKLGYQATLRGDGPEGLSFFEENHFRIDAVILDINMPKMNGWEVLAELKRVQRDVKVIIASGFHELPSDADAARRGIAGYVSKPFDLAELSQLLRRALHLG